MPGKEYSLDELNALSSTAADQSAAKEVSLDELHSLANNKDNAPPVVPSPNGPLNAYEGTNDTDLNPIQKLEKGAEPGGGHWYSGAVQPGSEIFAPATNKSRNQILATAGNDLALGYLPQAAGMLGSKPYLEGRDAMSKELADVPEGNKFAGHVLSGVGSFALPMLAPAETVAGRIGQAGLMGSALGGAQNPGDTEGSYSGLQLPQRAGNAVKGGLISAGMGAAGEGLQAANEGLGDYLTDLGERKAVKQAGPMLADFKAMNYKETLNETGRALLDNGVITPGASLSDITDRTEKIMQEKGKQIGAVYSALDSKLPQLAADPRFQGDLITGTKVADAMDGVIAQFRGSPALEDMVGPLQAKADAFRARGDAPVPFETASQWKQDFDKLLNWDKLGGPGKEGQKQLRGALNGVIENSIDSIGQKTKFPLYQKWKDAKNTYGIMQNVNEFANDQLLSRAQKNRSVSPSDYGMGLGVGTMAAAGLGKFDAKTVALGVAGAVINHAARKYGPGLIAVGADRTGQALNNFRAPMPNIPFRGQPVQPAASGLISNTAAPFISNLGH